jgi:dolichol-phosphate mannosyltransferase
MDPGGRRRIVILPTYNEAPTLPRLLPRLRRDAPEFEVLIVDDDSPDGTGQIADEAARDDDAITVMHRAGKQGLGSAYVDGFREALSRGADEIFEMDADLSHNPIYLPAISACLADADLAIGSRYRDGVRVNNWPFRRLLLSKAANYYATLASGIPPGEVMDATSGFRGYRREALLGIGLNSVRSNGYAFQVEMVFRCYRRGLRIKEVPIVFEEHYLSESKLSAEIVWEAVWRIPSLRLLVRNHRPGPGASEGG